MTSRTTVHRTSRETDIQVVVDPDGSGQTRLDTGVGFFDHFLGALAYYAGFDLEVKARGDLHVDAHHLAEDTGLALGAGLQGATTGERSRYGHAVIPMDDALVLAALDAGGRPYFAHNLPARLNPGPFSAEVACEFLRALTTAAGWCLHVRYVTGDNGHHVLEAVAKAVGMAAGQALQPTGNADARSTKGRVRLEVGVEQA
ncbi:MAG: imidazoleglycerol-phosphate dehydratase [Bacillota bacterium]